MKNELQNSALRLMAGRGGYTFNPNFSITQYTEDGLVNLSQQLNYQGGYLQQDRMIRDKRKTLDKAVLYSYQGAFVRKIDDEERPVRALINPNKLKQDYDDKIVSIGYEYNFEPGTVFEWCNTNSFWLVYLQDLDELAYFRGEIRRCRYEITQKTASTAPAAPKRCPIADFVEDIFKSLHPTKSSLTALASMASPTTVDVPCALI